jgi:hypothetical protein
MRRQFLAGTSMPAHRDGAKAYGYMAVAGVPCGGTGEAAWSPDYAAERVQKDSSSPNRARGVVNLGGYQR